jgi:hypothetical protein
MPSIKERRLQKRRAGYSVDALRTLAADAGMELEYSRIVSGQVGRRWEYVDGRLFGLSRSLHSLLFPFVNLAAWLTIPRPRPGDSGTILYVFRKRAAEGASRRLARDP